MFESQSKLLFDVPLSVVHSRKLDTALRNTVVSSHRSRKSWGRPTFDDKLFDASYKYLFRMKNLDDDTANYHIWPEMLTDAIKGLKVSDASSYRRAVELTAASVKVQVEFNNNGNKSKTTSVPVEMLTDYARKIQKFPSELMNLISLSKILEECVERLGLIDHPSYRTEQTRLKNLPKLCCYKNDVINFKTCWSKNLACISYKGITTVVPRDYLLLLHNKCSDLVSVLAFAFLSDGAGLDEGCYSQTVQFLTSLAEIPKKYGNNGYSILKTLESVGIGQTLIEVDGVDNSAFLDEILTGLMSKYKFDFENHKSFRIMKAASIPFRHELMCLMKTLGHPFVDMRLGTKQLHDIVTDPLDIDASKVANCVRHAKRSYIKTHIMKEHKWPPCKIEGSQRLQIPFSEDRDPDASIYMRRLGACKLDEYDFVEILPNIKFDECENLIPMIKDKTISVLRSSVIHQYLEGVKSGSISPASREINDDNMQAWINDSSENPSDSDEEDDYTSKKRRKKRKKRREGDPEEESNLEFINEGDSDGGLKEFLSKGTAEASTSKPSKAGQKSRKTQRDVWKETRLLLYYMVNEKKAVSHLKYIQEFCDKENLDFSQFLDYLVIRIVPKEKEMKVDFRGYGCKTFMDRARSVISEHNIANYLGKYCHEQAITLSELEIMNRLVSFRRLAKAYRNYTPLYIVIDSSKWNNRFRTETVNPITKNLIDPIFDNNYFSHVMPTFEHTMIYVPDQSEIWYWWGQFGGIEGHHQYLWDVVYLAQIKTALEGCGFPDPVLFVKGDDLRAIVMIPPQELASRTLEDIRKSIVTAIKTGMEALGHKINVGESYGSSKYFAFGKMASVGTIEMPQTFRKIEKCYGANNAFLPFLDDYIGSSFSNAHSSAKVTSSTIHCFVVSVFWMYLHLCTHPLYRRLTNNELISMSFIPSLLGGFPIIYLHNMWVRAETDLLAPFLGLLKFLEVKYKDLFDCCRKFLRVNNIEPYKAFVGLLIDPYSLPIQKPVACATVLRMKIQKIMKSLVVNEDIRQLMDAAESPEMKAVIDTLFTANVYSVKILSAIYEASPAGLLNELIRKFESGRSVIQVIITALGRARANRFVKAVLFSEKRLHKFRISTINEKVRGKTDLIDIFHNSNCPGKIAEDIRTFLWKKPVEGLSMPPIQHQILIADPEDVFTDKFAHDHHFEYNLLPSDYNLGVELPMYKACDRRPFTGHSTVMGVTAAKEQLIDRNEVTDKAKRLIDLLSWVRMHPLMKDGTEPNLEDVIYILLTFYVDLDPNELTPFKADRKHGTIAHHVRISAARESIVTNSLLNIFTRFEGNSNSHLKFRWESGHFMVNFLHIFCHSLFLMSMRLQFSNVDFQDIVRNWAITVNCDFCLRTIEESPVRVDLKKLQGKTFRKFHSTEISQLAKEIIKESLSVVDVKLERLIQPAASLTLANATSAIIQDYLVMGHINKEKMNDFNYKHTMSTEAKEILSDIYGVHKTYKLSQSEVKSMPMSVVFENLIISVVEYVYKEHRQHKDVTVAAFLTERPYSEFPWTDLISVIYESGFLTHLVQLAATRSGSLAPSVYSSVAGASIFIAQCAYRVYEQQHSKFKIYPAVFLSHFKIKDVEKYVRPRAIIIKHKLAKSSLYPLQRSYRSTDEDRLELMDMAMVFWNLPLYDELDLNESIAKSGLNTIIHIDLLNYDKVDEMYIEDLDDLPGCCRAYFLSDFFPVSYADRADILNENDSLKIRAVINLKQTDMVAKMEFIYATIEDCINRIRSHKKEFPLLRSNVHADVDLLNQLSYDNRDRGVRDVFFIKNYTDSTANPIRENYVVPETEYPYPRYLKTWYANRILGFGTSAPSKLAEIFAFLGFSRLPSNSAYSCLADGFGGFAAYIDTLTRRSKILFNTLIVDSTMEAHPSDWDASRSRNEVEYEALKFHYHDLTLLTTIDKLIETFPYQPLIVTCDAQTVGMDMRLRENLLCNVLTYFLRTRLPSSCLIIKLYMNEFDLNMRLIHFMRPRVLNIHLMKPKASGDNDELYGIFDGGPIGSYQEPNPVVLDGSPWPNLNVCNFLYKTFTNYKLGIKMKRTNSIIVKYNLEVYSELLTTPPLAVRTTMNKLGLPIDVSSFDDIAKDGYKEVLKYVYTNIEHIMFEAQREYNVLGDPNQGSKQAYDHLTLTSKQHRMGRFFTILGFGISLKLFEQGVHLTESLMREWFVKIYKINRPKFDIAHRNPAIFFKGPVGASEFDLYSQFLDGVEMGLSLTGSLIYKYRSYPKDLKVTAKHSIHKRYDGVFAPVPDHDLFDPADNFYDPFGNQMMSDIYHDDSRLDDYYDDEDLDNLSDIPDDADEFALPESYHRFEGDPEVRDVLRILLSDDDLSD